MPIERALTNAQHKNPTVERVAKHYRIGRAGFGRSERRGARHGTLRCGYCGKKEGLLCEKLVYFLEESITRQSVNESGESVDQQMARHKQLRKTCEILNV